MNALLLPFFARSHFSTADAAATVNRPTDALDLAGARIHLETDNGVVAAWYLGAKPRGEAMVKPLGRASVDGDEPNQYAVAHARQLLECGVSVLLVDVRGCGSWWARLHGHSVGHVVHAAVDYLVARGHEQDECAVDGW